MEKTYKVKMYECRYPNYEFREKCAIIHFNQLIDFVNKTLRKKLTQCDACQIINCGNDVEEVIVEFTNDDFIGNIKPDGSITQKIRLRFICT